MNFDHEKLGNALGGMGAGFAGRDTSAYRKEAQAIPERRKKAMAEDAFKMIRFMEDGQREKAIKLGQNRVTSIEKVGGDPSSTLEVVQSLMSGTPDGDVFALTQLKSVVGAAQDLGMLPKDDVIEYDKERGGVVTRQLGGGYKFNKLEGVGKAPRDEGDLQKQVNELRKSYKTSEDDFKKVEAAKNRIVKSGKRGTPASDISLVFNFMKMNDPGSTVREGEYATAENARGVPETVSNMYNKMKDGLILTDSQRDDFMKQSEALFSAQRFSFDTSIDNMLQMADQDNIKRVRLLGEDRLGAFNKRWSEYKTEQKAGQKSAVVSISTQAEFDALPSGTEYTDAKTGKKGRKP